MFLFSSPVKVVQTSPSKGTFEIEGLYPGYGVTIGNSLRRVLLSSLEGAAITQIKIEGVAHEFSTIPGVQEDVLGIMLNLKQLRFKLYGEEPQTASIKVKGEKTVTGKDIQLPSQLELITKDSPVARLTEKDAELTLELRIERGMGYVPAEVLKRTKTDIGTIAMDAIFSPVQKVGMKTENMRVGERTDFDRVTLEIETDGSISPEQALHQACSLLMEQFRRIDEGVKEIAEQQAAAAPKEKPKAEKAKKMSAKPKKKPGTASKKEKKS